MRIFRNAEPQPAADPLLVDTQISKDEIEDPRDERLLDASPMLLAWRSFRKHKLAVVGLIVLLFIYLIAIFADFIAPKATMHFNPDYTYAPPQRIHFLRADEDGGTKFAPYLYGYSLEVNPDTYAITLTVDEENLIPLGFFVRGYEYNFLGLVPMDRHFFGPINPDDPAYFLGADRNGRDLFSRTIHGTRVSMTVGLVGVAFAFILGVTLGGISGYFGGTVDIFIQRMIEFFMSIPTLPLWLGLAAALPSGWSPLERYFAITVILAITAWTDLARVVRGRFIALRGEEFVVAAEIDGNSRRRIIFRHIMPSISSHLIASLTLSIPAMILAETALSFLGLGLQPPVVSWGVLLQDAQNVRALATAPWLLSPAIAIVVAVLALNFVGDGLRDAADPYKN